MKHELPTLLADGETGDGSGVLLDLIEEGTVQVAQPDTYRLGLLSYLDYARQVGDRGGLIGPHTWANRIKVVETCLLGMVAPNSRWSKTAAWMATSCSCPTATFTAVG